MRFLLIALFFTAFSVLALSKKEINDQMRTCFKEYSVKSDIMETDCHFSTEFNRFLEILSEIPDHGLLQLTFVPMFFLKSIFVGLLPKPALFEDVVLKDAYSASEAASKEAFARATMRLMERRLGGEKKLERVIDSLLRFLKDLHLPESFVYEKKQTSVERVLSLEGDSVSFFIKNSSASSPRSALSAVSTDFSQDATTNKTRSSFRRCSACAASGKAVMEFSIVRSNL